MDGPFGQSFIYVGGISVVARFVQSQLKIGTIAGDGGMAIQLYAIPIGAAALGYYWYGPMGIVGALAGTIAGGYAYDLGMAALNWA